MARILVVDDEPHIRHFAATWLELHKHKVTLADNGRDALDVLRKRDFDLLITDVGMPKLDGIELIEALRERSLPRAVIVLTARHDEKQLSVQNPRQHIRVLSKPFDPQKIIVTVQELLGSPPVSGFTK